jgi:alkylated DNA repair protein alkB family protein 8
MKNLNKEEKILKDLEDGYNQIAKKFSETRKYFWKDFEFMKKYVKENDRILDFGCGNGRLIELLGEKKYEYFGVDVSQKLIDIARKKYQGDRIIFQKISSSSSLTFPPNFFNVIFSLAVFHHFPKKHREKMARELFRITQKNGLIIVSVWNLWQIKYWKNFSFLKILIRKILQRERYQDYGIKDIEISFKDNEGKIFNRFHHIFSERELKLIFEKAGFKTEEIFTLSNKNIIFIGRK